MDTLDTKNEQKRVNYFRCEKCDYSTCRKLNFDRHNSTDKHKMIHWIQNCEQNEQQLSTTYNKCVCGKVYKYSQGLSKHKKTCPKHLLGQANEPANEIKTLTNLVLEIVKQNTELISINNETNKYNQQMTSQLVKLYGNTTNITNYSNNQTFNLNVFLNETCKDAMNINDFVDSLHLQLSDLEDVGKLGFVNGISNIILKNLKALDIHKRPVHCADKKREIIYIKDEDKWEKENEQKQRLRKAIKRIALKNENLLPKYKELHPGCNYSDSKFSDQYSKLVIEAMGGLGHNETEQHNKIIKNIAKEIVITSNDKTHFIRN